MTPPPSLSGSYLRTFERIFQHPLSHNLEWREVHALFGHLGQIAEEPNGNFKVTRNGQVLVLHAPRTKDVEKADELIGIRHFLERSEKPVALLDEKKSLWLVVIDHHEARLFRPDMQGATMLQILPHEPSEFFRHAPNSKEFARGREKPEANSFFAPVAKALQNAGKILLFGNGTGTSSEMDLFAAWLKSHHPEVAARIIGTVAIDEHHLTNEQILAKAREYYAK